MMNKKVLIVSILFALFSIQSISYATTVGEETSPAKLILKLVLSIIVFILILIFAFYGTKFFAKKSKKFLRSKYMEIIDTISLGNNVKIIIAKILDQVYILSVTNNNVNIIDKFKDTEFDDKYDEKFEKYLDKYKYETPNYELNNVQMKIKSFISKLNRKIKNTSKEEEENEKNS